MIAIFPREGNHWYPKMSSLLMIAKKLWIDGSLSWNDKRRVALLWPMIDCPHSPGSLNVSKNELVMNTQLAYGAVIRYKDSCGERTVFQGNTPLQCSPTQQEPGGTGLRTRQTRTIPLKTSIAEPCISHRGLGLPVNTLIECSVIIMQNTIRNLRDAKHRCRFGQVWKRYGGNYANYWSTAHARVARYRNGHSRDFISSPRGREKSPCDASRPGIP